MIGLRSRLRFATLITVVLAAFFVDGGGRPTAAAAAAAASAEDQDLKARKLFAAGDYRQALELYVNLYAETLHPTYLRNIGRCQQNLGEADKAIGSFREYLRKAKDLSPAQRQEIEGYIAEMEELKRKQAGGGAVAGPPSPSTSTSTSAAAGAGAAPPAPGALAAPPPATSGPAPAALLSSPAPAPADDGGSPFYTRAWFWVVVGAVAAGTVTAVFLLTRDDSKGPLDTLDLRGGQTP